MILFMPSHEENDTHTPLIAQTNPVLPMEGQGLLFLSSFSLRSVGEMEHITIFCHSTARDINGEAL